MVKHSEASVVNVEVVVTRARELNITIRDNGLGFNNKSVDGGMGLSSMQARMQRTGGAFSIASDNNGTSIVLLYPLP